MLPDLSFVPSIQGSHYAAEERAGYASLIVVSHCLYWDSTLQGLTSRVTGMLLSLNDLSILSIILMFVYCVLNLCIDNRCLLNSFRPFLNILLNTISPFLASDNYLCKRSGHRTG